MNTLAVAVLCLLVVLLVLVVLLATAPRCQQQGRSTRVEMEGVLAQVVEEATMEEVGEVILPT